MDYIHSMLLGALQGLTEFLPVSSSAHLAVFPMIFKIKSELLNSLSFDISLHAGTLIGVLVYFRHKIMKLIIAFFNGFKNSKYREDTDFKLGVYLIIATIPAVFAALFFGDYIETTFRNPLYISAALIIFGIILFWADRTGVQNKKIEGMNMRDALIIGVLQMAALMPGVSRSGITITAALFIGYRREDAAEFSFLMSIPAIAGAVVYSIKNIINVSSSGEVYIIFVGFLSAVISGFFAVSFLIGFVKKHSFDFFVGYRIILGVSLVFFVLKGLI